ncbi:ArfGap-domain-containing protein [Microthyrium microscopicum]|uniref:ADP-ribosylation factor GTPase-activating protein n=1 Tax=Microthyrium microscopicum TaxID=703497 RepID=A0A6A6UK13_9PEZI|nr:ArfGap-domain-containing protein [Microthyrium microscopicum]
MGNITSRPGEDSGGSVYLRDQTRFAISGITITNARNKVLLHITPNEYPATRYVPKRDSADDPPVEFIQDPDASPSAGPSFLLKLQNEDDLIFNFSFIVRQQQDQQSNTSAPSSLDTSINGLTFIFAATPKDLDNLVTNELHADPNLHKNNPNVQLVGDYSTNGNGSFVEYDQRNHRLDPLVSFQFWVNNARPSSSQKSPIRLDPGSTVRLRVPSAQSIESRISDSDDGGTSNRDGFPVSPGFDVIAEDPMNLEHTVTGTTAASVKLDVNCRRPGDDITAAEDGPLFRATMKAMESKTSNMRTRWKKVMRQAEIAYNTQQIRNDAIDSLLEALREAAVSNANAVQPAMEHYFDKIAKEILQNDRRNTRELQKLIVEPISRLYALDIKQADQKKRDFDEESKEYYSFVSRYLGQRQDSLKEKKRIETDTKYQTRRTRFELKRLDYSSYLQDLHGGRKDQEILSNLTRFADSQAKGYIDTAKKIDAFLPQLEALNSEVRQADNAFKMHRSEREEKRRALEKSIPTAQDSEGVYQGPTSGQYSNGTNTSQPAVDNNSRNLPIGRSQSQSVQVSSAFGSLSSNTSGQGGGLSSSPSNKFKGIRDLEERDYAAMNDAGGNAAQRKEGLVWALSRPGLHIDPRGLNKQAWHKFWIVLDQGKLSEYTNWKQKLDLHMDPIDLRIASVREARNADRRFCFEVVTPNFTRVYQATSEEDMKSWIYTINNALQSAVESRDDSQPVSLDSPSGSIRKDFATALTGKSNSQRFNRDYSGHKVGRHATVGDRPPNRVQIEPNESSLKLLEKLKEADESNRFCADCGSESKVDWVSINLSVIICIECSGIHRSLGTHVSKVRSLTLDPNAFTQDVVEILLTLGNRTSNNVWEAKLDRALKPNPQSSREQRLRFITSKYSERAFVAPISSTLSHYGSADETLLASIKKNDIANVAYALALQASPNVVDKSRSTHAIYLALAAADPASPGGMPSPNLSEHPSPPQQPNAPPTRKPFPIAELLILNGATLPIAPPPIPLSRSARLYLESKASQLNGRRMTTTSGNSNSSNPIANSPGEHGIRRKRLSSGGRLQKPLPSQPAASPPPTYGFGSPGTPSGGNGAQF